MGQPCQSCQTSKCRLLLWPSLLKITLPQHCPLLTQPQRKAKFSKSHICSSVNPCMSSCPRAVIALFPLTYDDDFLQQVPAKPVVFESHFKKPGCFRNNFFPLLSENFAVCCMFPYPLWHARGLPFR